MKISDLRDNPGARKKAKLLGRGIGSGKGKTSGRGGKGQTARSGVAINGFEGGQTPIHRRLPKRGFNSLNNEKIDVINLGQIQVFIDNGKLPAKGVISKSNLVEASLVQNLKRRVKLLAKGELTSKVDLEVDFVSGAASEAVAKLGGNVIVLS
jgi:large subunit ribosomal protein L15